MSVVLLIAAAAILIGVIAVSLGRGGELASFAADVPPVRAEIVTAGDVALIRPPTALFGYHPQVTDDLLGTLARTVSDQDAEIISLRRQLDDLRRISPYRPLPVRGAAAAPHPPAGTGPIGPAGSAEPAGPADD